MAVLNPCCFADLDVNAVAGTVTVDGAPAGTGTVIEITDSDGLSVLVEVDGGNVPPFLKGQGRFDTGDVDFFETGEEVTLSIPDLGWENMGITLLAGTTTLDLEVMNPSVPDDRVSRLNRSMDELASLSSVIGTLGEPGTAGSYRESDLAGGLVDSTLTLETHILSIWDRLKVVVSDRLVDLFLVVNDGMSNLAVVMGLAEGIIMEPALHYGVLIAGMLGGIILLSHDLSIRRRKRAGNKRVIVEEVHPFWDSGCP